MSYQETPIQQLNAIWQRPYAQVKAAFEHYSPPRRTISSIFTYREIGGHTKPVVGRKPYHSPGFHTVDGVRVHVPENMPLTSSFETPEQYNLALAAVNTVMSGILRGDQRWYQPTINLKNRDQIDPIPAIPFSQRILQKIEDQVGKKNVAKAVIDSVVDVVNIAETLYPNLAIANNFAMSFAGIGGFRVGVFYSRIGEKNNTGQIVWPVEALPMTHFEGLHDGEGRSVLHIKAEAGEVFEAVRGIHCEGTASGPELIRQIALALKEMPKELQDQYRIFPNDRRYREGDIWSYLLIELKLKHITRKNAVAARRMHRRGQLS